MARSRIRAVARARIPAQQFGRMAVPLGVHDPAGLTGVNKPKLRCCCRTTELVLMPRTASGSCQLSRRADEHDQRGRPRTKFSIAFLTLISSYFKFKTRYQYASSPKWYRLVEREYYVEDVVADGLLRYLVELYLDVNILGWYDSGIHKCTILILIGQNSKTFIISQSASNGYLQSHSNTTLN